MQHIAMITNPTAHRGKAMMAANAALKVFESKGIEVDFHLGTSRDNVIDLTHRIVEQDAIDAIVACGGDGHINSILQSVAQTGMPLGIIPAGSGNDFARHFKIPRNPTKAAKAIVKSETKQIDLGRITGPDSDGNRVQRWFGTIACAGFDSLVSIRAENLKWPQGASRFNVALLQEFLALKAVATTLTLDSGETIELDATLVAVANTSSYGGGKKIAPEAKTTDGVFDITVVPAIGRATFAKNFRRVFDGTVYHMPGVYKKQAKSLTYYMWNLDMSADGEYMSHMPCTLECVPGALTLIAPPKVDG